MDHNQDLIAIQERSRSLLAPIDLLKAKVENKITMIMTQETNNTVPLSLSPHPIDKRIAASRG